MTVTGILTDSDGADLTLVTIEVTAEDLVAVWPTAVAVAALVAVMVFATVAAGTLAVGQRVMVVGTAVMMAGF